VTYLETDAELAVNSVFGVHGFNELRESFVAMLAEQAPTWLTDGRPSVIRTLWDRIDVVAGMELAAIIETVSAAWAGIGDDVSGEIMVDKFRELLTKRDPDQFQDLLTELQVLAGTQSTAGVTELEPWNRPRSTANATKSPDLAWHIGSDVMDVEVTVFRWQPINDTERQADNAGKYIFRQLIKHNVLRRVHLEVDLNARAMALAQDKSVIAQLVAQPEGKVDRNGCTLTWSSNSTHIYPMGNFFLELEFAPELESLGSSSFNRSVRMPPGCLEKMQERFIERLDNKKRQLDRGRPSMLVVADGSRFLDQVLFNDVMNRRVWNNPKFSWLTIAGLLVPRTNQLQGMPNNMLLGAINPSPRYPAPEPFANAFAGAEPPPPVILAPGVDPTAASVVQGIFRLRETPEAKSA
jgi:hypothetical protein